MPKYRDFDTIRFRELRPHLKCSVWSVTGFVDYELLSEPKYSMGDGLWYVEARTMDAQDVFEFGEELYGFDFIFFKEPEFITDRVSVCAIDGVCMWNPMTGAM